METRQYTIKSSAISLITDVEMPNGYLTKTPLILSNSAIFLTGPGGGSVSLLVKPIRCLYLSSSVENPIGSSSVIGKTKLNKINRYNKHMTIPTKNGIWHHLAESFYILLIC